jgi:hypothetical protein
MAITRTQIAKQLLAQGGRIGLQGGGADMGAEDKAQERADKGYGDTSGPDRSRTTREQDANQRNVVREARIREIEKLIDRPTVRERISKGLTNIRNRNIKKFIDRSIRKDLFRSGFVPNSFMGINLPTTLGIASETAYSLFGPEVDSFDEDSLREIASTLTTTGGSLTKSQSKALESFAKNIANRDELLEKGMTQERFEELYPKPVIDDRDGPQPLDPCKGPNPPAYCFIGEKAEETIEAQRNLAGLTPRIGGSMFDFTNMADGGLAAIDREAFLLGGIAKGLKKATRAVKKIAKSPIGKAALGIAAFKFGPTIFGKGSFNPFLRTVAGDTAFSPLGSILSKAGLVSKSGLPTFTGGITLASILPLLAGKTDDEKEDILNDYFASQELTPSTTKRQAGSEFDFYNYNLAEGGRIGYSSGSDDKKNKPKKNKLPIEIPVSPLDERINELYEKLNLKEGLKALEKRKLNSKGGSQKEPVAKKVMPLLDMGGMEKDYRAEGGFVPIGRMEKADDVPARLSKNEFVFTADAVRNAGDGNVDKGAEVMYNMMKNLERGGNVSDESQGLEGARKMFQTSKRLEEVL